MRILIPLLAAMALSPPAVSQEIYRWVDRNGVVHYSDQPGPGAERITVSGSVARPAEEPETPELYSPDRPPDGAPGAAYQSISITSPAMDEAFFGADADVDVQIALDGELQPGHEIALYLDGQRAGNDGPTATLSGVGRGTHSLRAAVIDESGNTLLTSPDITFHVRQPSIANPPVGPALRPPPPKPPAKPPAPKAPTNSG
jgi:hypothetical protein